MAKQRLAIIGAGHFAELCLNCYRSINELQAVSVYDSDNLAAARLAAKFNLTPHRSVAKLLEDETITIVAILTPPRSHYRLAKKALAAKKHLLVEKPIALTEAAASRLVELAKRGNRQMTSNFVLRFHPGHRQLREIVASDRYGSLQQIITVAHLAKYPADHWYWERSQSGGFFLNTYTHFFDLYRFISGEEPRKFTVSGDCGRGQTIVSHFPFGLATLAVNINAPNGRERVATTYLFERATVSTFGWLPERLEITVDSGRQIQQDFTDKLSLYRQILANIMRELIDRINNPAHRGLINHQVQLSAVIDAKRAELKDASVRRPLPD